MESRAPRRNRRSLHRRLLDEKFAMDRHRRHDHRRPHELFCVKAYKIRRESAIIEEKNREDVFSDETFISTYSCCYSPIWRTNF